MKKLILILLIALLFFSCEDVYYDFADDEMAFVNYKEGDQFKMVNLSKKDTLIFNIIKREDTYNFGGSSLINNTYLQSVNVFFETSTNERGHLFYYKQKELTFCDLSISSSNATVIFVCFSADTNNSIESFNVQGISYDELFLFVEEGELKNDTLFYSPTQGIVKFSVSENGSEYVLIE